MRHSSLKDWPGARSLCIASSQQVKLDEAQRKREKGKKKGYTLFYYRFYFYFLGIDNVFCF